MMVSRFTVPDHGLWDEIASSIQPLGRKRGRPMAGTKMMPQTRTTVSLHTSRTAPVPPIPRPRVHPVAPPDLSPLDRRTAQKLARGQLDPEARLDLHGENRESARLRLFAFVQSNQQRGLRLVLVITGKGHSPLSGHLLHGHRLTDSPEREGRLRRDVPAWLHEASFRSYVVGFQPAHPRHGGGGALYVRLRRHREGQT